jgi:hypothetical protein
MIHFFRHLQDQSVLRLKYSQEAHKALQNILFILNMSLHQFL